MKRLPADFGLFSMFLRAAICTVCCSEPVFGQPVPSPREDPSQIAATVAGKPILVPQVRRQMMLALGDRALPTEVQPRLMAESLKQLVGQHIVVDYLAQQGQAASGDETKLEIEQIAERLSAVSQTLDEFLRDNALTREALEANVAWQVSWSRYLERKLTDENLLRFFEQNKRVFDGTTLEVAHLLIKVEDPDSSDQWQQATELARSIRKQLSDGQISWAAAVASYSQAATSEGEASLGWIQYDGPMSEAFSRAAFALQIGDVSPPVQTPAGVHLIKCLNVKTGNRGWQDSREQIRRAATQFLFDWIIQQHQSAVEIRYTGNSPYFDPVDGQLRVGQDR